MARDWSSDVCSSDLTKFDSDQFILDRNLRNFKSRMVVNVVSQVKYTEWVAEQKNKQAATADDPNKTWTLDELKARGEKVYSANCVACHQVNGLGLPGAFPALDGSKMAKGPKNAHIDQVLNGKTGTAMVSFKQLSDVELAAVVTYERNAWNNKTGDMVAPADIKARRK
jgi:cytochrome c oxidase subunit 2